MMDAMQAVAGHIGRQPLFAALCVVAVGQAAMNAAYGYQYWGGGNMSGAAIVFATIYIGIEGVKLASAHMLGQSVRAGAWVSAAGLFVLVAMTLYFSMQAHIGFIGSFRNDQMAGREAAVDQRDTDRQRLRLAREERGKLGTVRPVEAIRAEEALECRSGVGRRCTMLRTELATAARAVQLDGEIAGLSRQRVSTGSVGMADPHTRIMGWVSTASGDDKKLLLTIFGALAIELSTVLGFFFAGDRGKQSDTLADMLAGGLISHPGAQTVVDFKAQCLDASRGASLAEDDVWAAFEAWRKRSGSGEIQRAAFLRLLEASPIRRRDGRFYGVSIKPAWFLAQAG